MSRLYDRIMARSKKTTRNFLSGATVVVADNVMSLGIERGVYEAFKAPASPVPFNHCFVEIKPPQSDMYLEIPPNDPTLPSMVMPMPYAWSVCLKSFRYPEHKRRINQLMGDLFGSPPYRDTDLGEWLVSGDFFVEWSKHNILHEATFILRLNERGESDERLPVWLPNDGSLALYSRFICNKYPGYFEDPNGCSGMCLDALWRPLDFSLALLNSKNVELIDNPPPPALSRAHQKKTGEPLVTYKTIKVNPVRTVKHLSDPDAQQVPNNSQSMPLPLHITRGHFKDFRDSKGLFGNPALKGFYWWDQYVRGSIENGVTVKDYEVQAPKTKDGQP
jgi:hypothetical protein